MSAAATTASISCTRPEAVARLEEAAFSDFYSRTSRGVWSYIYRVTGNAADADDIVQEAFLRLLRAEVDGGDEEWRRYVYRVASNLVVDRWRRLGRERGREQPPLTTEPEATPDRDVARTFAELTARDRALLWLAYVEGETHADIAASLGVGSRSVKVLLFRARRRLRDLLTARGIFART